MYVTVSRGLSRDLKMQKKVNTHCQTQHNDVEDGLKILAKSYSGCIIFKKKKEK